MYIEVTENGKVFKGKVAACKVVLVSIQGVISLGLAIGVSVSVILFVVLIFVILFIFWIRKYSPYTVIERTEDGAGEECY